MSAGHPQQFLKRDSWKIRTSGIVYLRQTRFFNIKKHFILFPRSRVGLHSVNVPPWVEVWQSIPGLDLYGVNAFPATVEVYVFSETMW